MFICGGAFERLLENPLKSKTIGFNTAYTELSDCEASELSPEALVKFGLIPELVGRFPVLCSLANHSENDLVRILMEPEDAIIKEYQMLFEKDGILLTYENDALKEIAKMALNKKTGARGLRSILEDVMLDIMYEMPDIENIYKCIITKDSIETKQPKIIKKRQRKRKLLHLLQFNLSKSPSRHLPRLFNAQNTIWFLHIIKLNMILLPGLSFPYK